MAQAGTPAQPLRVAIIGAGPTGYYAADHLLRQDRVTVEVDMFDRLPTPYGLVRLGVAPDHQKIKSVTAAFDKVAAHPRFRFFGGVEFGKDLTLADLRAHYHQRSEEHTSELQSRSDLVCRLLLEKTKN